jgi:hypothetical protein
VGRVGFVMAQNWNRFHTPAQLQVLTAAVASPYRRGPNESHT